MKRIISAALLAAIAAFAPEAREVLYLGDRAGGLDSLRATLGTDDTKWTDVTAPGCGSALAVFLTDSCLKSVKPDAVYIDFSDASNHSDATEGIARKIRSACPEAEIHFTGKANEALANHYAAKGLPTPLYGSEWDKATVYTPATICRKHGLWHNLDAATDSRLKPFAAQLGKVMASGHPKSTLSFAFEGDMFGLYDVAGPAAGRLEIYVDGQMIRLKNLADSTVRMAESTALTGSHYLKRANAAAGEGYALQYDLIKVEPGVHQVTLKLSEKGGDPSYLFLGGVLVRGTIAECNPVKGLPKMEQQLKWEKKITKYMERDEEQAALTDATLVVGSSSIDLWKSLETDFPGKNVIRRGVSGTKAIDLYNYRHLLIEPFNPKRIIIYEGDNEIGFKWTLEEMMASMKKLFHEVRRMKPDAEIYLVSVKPSPVRANRLGEIQAFNKALEEFALSQPNTGFIDIHTPMLDSEGKVRPELFLADRLHPAKEGYDIWREQFGKVINK